MKLEPSWLVKFSGMLDTFSVWPVDLILAPPNVPPPPRKQRFSQDFFAGKAMVNKPLSLISGGYVRGG